MAAAAAAAAASPLRVAVVGAGSIGREFATRHFGPGTGTAVSCVVDATESRAEALAADVGSVQAGARLTGDIGYRSRPASSRGRAVPHFRELGEAALEGCDCVYIGTTPASHAALVQRALGAGKHVILEKPIAASGTDADAIVAAAEAAAASRGLHTSLNIGMRWNAALHAMRERLRGGSLGKLQGGSLRLHFRAWPREWQVQPWCAGRAEGGALREVGTHFLFAVHELFGHGCVQRVTAEVEYPDGPSGSAAESSAIGALELCPRMLGVEAPLCIALSVRTDGQDCRGGDLYELEVQGEAGSLKLFDFTCLADGQGQLLVENAAYGRHECITSLHEACRRDGFSSSPTISMVSAREARNAQRVVDALLASNGRWVSVSYD